MTEPRPTFRDPSQSAERLRTAFARDITRPRTIADAAAESGLPLRDAERGLHQLVGEFDGHLRVTEKGALLFVFPNGFVKRKAESLARAASRAVGKAAFAVARFLVRAWLTVAILVYVGVFVAVLLGLAFTRQGNDRNRGSGEEIAGTLFRVLGDALFWTFHPFSPLSVYAQPAYGARSFGRRQGPPKAPFYERVNRFVFGPPPAQDDPEETSRRIVQEIRAQKGRIGLGDVMRVTGLPRDDVDHRMARLMLDYDGEVLVSEDGGITYRFEALRLTAEHEANAARGPTRAWAERKALPPLTGNDGESNALIALLNGFNLVMGFYALGAGLTVQRAVHLVSSIGHRFPLTPAPAPGFAWLLGLLPLVFSAAIFAMPLGRALFRPTRERETARENGRLALMHEVLTRIGEHAPLAPEPLTQAWAGGAGRAPSDGEFKDAVLSLGGDLDLEREEGPRYRFVDLETEAEALEKDRQAATEAEEDAGDVVFRSDA